MVMNAVLRHNIPIMVAKGLFHNLNIYPDHLVIHRTDILSRLFGSDEVISYNEIKDIHVDTSRLMIDAWSRLVIVCKNGRSRTLSYGARQQHIAQQVKSAVENFLIR